MKIIKVQLEDTEEAAHILVEAFKEDPIFIDVFSSRENYLKMAPWLFKTWITWAVKFGEAWMTEDYNSVLIMRSLNHSRMSLSSMIRAGMLLTPFKMGIGTFFRFYFNMVLLLDRKNREIMGDSRHWYGWMIGVKPGHNGIGRLLLKHCFDIADENELPVYLETSKLENVSLYHHYGFKTLNELDHPTGDFKLYFMMRRPKLIKV